MKTRILANIYSVLKDVEIQIATKKQINALMLVPMDSNFIGKQMFTSMTSSDE